SMAARSSGPRREASKGTMHQATRFSRSNRPGGSPAGAGAAERVAATSSGPRVAAVIEGASSTGRRGRRVGAGPFYNARGGGKDGPAGGRIAAPGPDPYDVSVP